MAILSTQSRPAKLPAATTSTNTDNCVFVGLDVHKETIVLAARKGNERSAWLAEMTFIVADGFDKLLKFLKKLAKHGELRCCYEASGAGFVLHRQLADWGFECEVIASSLIPSKPGDKRKCDRLDARRLADYYRSGLLTVVAVPSKELETARGVVRCRQAVQTKVTQSKHQLTKFLQTKGLAYREGTAWTGKHRTWLSRVKLDELDQFTFDEYLSMLEYLEHRLETLDQKLEELAMSSLFRESVAILRGFRGVQTLTAMVLVTELGDIRRFPTPRHVMSYVGLAPSVSQSGESRNKSSCITKAGSARCRHVLVQAAWNYTRKPKAASRDLKERQQEAPAWLIEQSWKAQQRLYDRFKHLEATIGKNKAVVAVARELAGFLAAALLKVAL